MSKRLTPDEKAKIISEYELAFRMANPGNMVSVVQPTPGWYRLIQRGGYMRSSSYRLSQLVKMTETLKARL